MLRNDSILQAVTSPIPDLGLSMENWVDSALYNGITNIHISPKGNKILDYYGKYYRRILNFDRCTGLVSLRDTFSVIEDTIISTLDFTPQIFTFSPNEKFLYGWNTSGFIQWDTESENISSSAIRLGGPTYFIESNGNIYTRNSWGPTGGQLAPDGRIYYMFNWSQYVINNPDERCPDCGFCYAVDYPINGCLDGFDIPYGSTPFFPNFRLGPIDGSVCDTLGIDNIPLARFRNERPDTADLFIQFKDLTAYEPTDWAWSFGDGNSSTLQNPSHDYTFPGIYTVCLTASNENGGDTACKEIDLRTSGVENTQTTNIDALVYPNPSNGFIQIGLPPSTGPLKFTLFDAQGKKISVTKEVLPQQIVPLSESISSGLYFYTIRDNKGSIWSGKIHIR